MIARLLDAYRGAARPIEVSAGAVIGQATGGLEVDDLVKAADALMYDIKKVGGNAFCLADLGALPRHPRSTGPG
ncbi:hypothetical protein [Rhabdothermincola sediminis]|uniref:hypothetical protein n=1 Tax=Rhabdothermincola sediminis TaxID=2751370 RepID=UPI001AA0692A|nr:hypothetical protein [Rhabdothermincola sediminis]